MQNSSPSYSGQAIGPEEIQQMQAIHEQKVAARNEIEQEKAQKKINAGSKVLKGGGGAANVAGKGMQVAGKGMKAGGKMMMRAGAELSATGAGAVLGVPLGLAGGLANMAGGGMDTSGKGVSRAGKSAGKIGRNMGDANEQSGILSRLKRAGAKGGFEGMIQKKAENEIKKSVKRQICGMPFASGIYGCYVFFINITTADKNKRIKLDLVDWFLLVYSNIIAICSTIFCLAIVVLIVDFMEADFWDSVLLAYRSILNFGWVGLNALIELF